MDLSYNVNIIGQDQPNPLDLTKMYIRYSWTIMH